MIPDTPVAMTVSIILCMPAVGVNPNSPTKYGFLPAALSRAFSICGIDLSAGP